MHSALPFDTLGEYQVTGNLGSGGMATVYTGYDPDLHRQVAIKVIHPHLAGDPTFRQRFLREARFVASLRHANIVQIYDYEIEDGRPVIVMEYLEGGTLRDRLVQVQRMHEYLPLAEGMRILHALASALDYAHGQGAVHRDLKPANVLFTANDEPVLVDFGIARLLDEAAGLTAPGSVMGTPAYMSPEQASGRPIDHRSDIYALGVLLYEMLTGRLPFTASSPAGLLAQHLHDTPHSPKRLNPQLPEPLAAVMLRALAKDANDRYESAGELARAAAASLSGVAVPLRPPQTMADQGTQHQDRVIADRAQIPAGAEEAATLLVAQDAATKPPTVTVATVDAATTRSDETVDDRSVPKENRLTHAVRRTLQLAPMVVPDFSVAESDLRGRLATGLSLVGLLFAVIQLLVDVGDFAQIARRPAGILVSLLPQFVGLVFLAGASVSLYGVARPSPMLKRKQAAALLAVVLLLGSGWGAWTTYASSQGQGRIVIAVGEFDGGRSQRYENLAGKIYETMEEAFAPLDDLVEVKRTYTTYANGEEARAAGERVGAHIVVWGWYDDSHASPHIELLSLPDLSSRPALQVNASAFAGLVPAFGGVQPEMELDVDPYLHRPLSLPSLTLFAEQAGQEMTYAATVIVGLAFYAAGDLDAALDRFDEAVALLESLDSPESVGGGAARFQRGTLYWEKGMAVEAITDLEAAVTLAPALFEGHYNLAIAYADECAGGSLDRAIAAAENAVDLQPQSTVARLLLGDFLLQFGRPQDAVAQLQHAAELAPGNPEIYEQLTRAYRAGDRADQAREAGNRALELRLDGIEQAATPSAADYVALGYAYSNAGRYAEAQEAFRTALGIAPEDLDAVKGLGNSYYWQENWQEATTWYQQAVNRDPDDGDANLMLGLALWNSGEETAALTAMERATATAVCDADPYLLLGGFHWQREEYDAASAAYRQALAIVPNHADAQYVLGSTYYLAGDPASAIGPLEEAIALAPDTAEVYRVLGQAHLELADYPAAMTAFSSLTALMPDDVAAFDQLGRAALLANQPEPAVQAFAAAIGLADSAERQVNYGMALLRLGKTAQALDAFQLATVLDPDYAEAYQWLGTALLQQNQAPEAVEAYRSALDRSESAEGYAGLANAYSELGDIERAITASEKAVTLAPDNWVFQLSLGFLYAQAGRTEGAVRAYEATLALNPDSADAHAGLGQMAYKQCRLSVSLQELTKATTLSDAPLWLGMLAAVYAARDDMDTAFTLVEQLEAVPDAAAHLTAGDLYQRTDRLPAAQVAYQQALALADDQPLWRSLAHTGIGQVHLLQDEILPAQSEFTAALQHWPANVQAMKGLGDAELRRQQAEGAVEHYEAALETLPDYARLVRDLDLVAQMEAILYGFRSLALAQAGRDAEAQESLQQALDGAQGRVARSPSAPSANVTLAVIYTIQEETVLAEDAFAAAVQCDASLAGQGAVLTAFIDALRE